MKKTTYINTYSNKQIWPLEADEEDIYLIDIGHALSMLCRANGHCKHFYSVGQHSINCAEEARNRELSKRIQLACLLHDASEAYISDITRPVKRCLPEYLVYEEKLQKLIYKKFGLDELTKEEEAHVKSIDDAMLNYEMNELLDIQDINNEVLTKDYDLSFRPMNQVRDDFINLTQELMK